MLIERIFPLKATLPKEAKVKDADLSSINPTKVLKVRVLGLDFDGIFTSYTITSRDRANFEEAPHDFEQIINAIDTDTYIKQAFMKYQELFWKEGWDIIGENPDAVNYLWQRIDYMEEVMEMPFSTFLREVVDTLVKFDNVFIVEARGDMSQFYPHKLQSPPGKDPIVGYYIIPTETVKIRRNKFNKPLQYRQSLKQNGFYTDIKVEPTFNADEVIHLRMHQKRGRPFGTPMIVGAIDDVKSLRQMEEDILNVSHKELFPFYQYTVGTEDKPSTPDEIEQAARELANMRVDGGIILPERHKIEVLGGEGKALDISGYLQAFKERVAMGLGVYPHHLGIMGAGTNRSATDRLDIALYDKVKLIQSYVEDVIRLKIFNPLLREGGFNPMTTPSATGDSDRCIMRFREIDIETQIKKENHIIQKFVNNIVELDETRIALGMDPDVDPNQLLMTMQAQVQTAQQIHILDATAKLTPSVPGSTTTTTKAGTATSGASKTVTKTPGTPAPKALPPAAKKPDAVQPSLGGRANQPNNKKNKNDSRPSNQHGRRSSPSIRHFDDDMLTEIAKLLDEGDVNE